MNSLPELSIGCLEKIVKDKEKQEMGSTSDPPVVQILGSKKITNGSIRCILFDGINTFKTVVIKKSVQNDVLYDNNQLENYSVIRLEQFWVSTMDSNDLEVIIVTDITPIMKGSEINRKLEAFPPMDDSIDMSLINSLPTSVGTDLNNTFNPNYRPPKRSHKELVLEPINRSNVIKIADIQPFMPSFVICCRITNKTPIRVFKKRDESEGKVFSFDVTDVSSEIRITAFNNECEKYYDIIEKDLIYYISKGSVKIANKRFSNLKSDFEITLTPESVIEVCEESVPLPSIKFNFVSIAQLINQRVGASVDVIGVITGVQPLQQFVSKKNQKEYLKRDVSLLDKSLHEVRLTLWGELANNFNANIGQVLAVKSAIVGEYMGKTLSCVQNSIIELDADLPEAHLLKGWYDRESKGDRLRDVVPLCRAKDETQTQFKYLCQINKNSIPENSLLFFNCKATILSINPSDRHLYKACGHKGCSKKVKEENGFYFCDKCGNNSPDFKWRLMLPFCCADCTADVWLTAFQEVAEKMIGKKVDDISDMFESDPHKYETLISGLYFKTFIFRIGCKIEEYNNEKRVKYTCYAVTPIDTIETSKKLIQTIKSMNK